MARRQIDWDVPRRLPARDTWDEYTREHGWPEPRSRFYDLFERSQQDDPSVTYEFWPGEREPRVVRRRR